MSAEEFVKTALRALAGHDQSVEAGPQLEARLRAQFRHRMMLQAWRRAALWTAAAAAVVVLVALSNEWWRPRPASVSSGRQSPPPVVAPAPKTPLTVEAPKPRQSRPRVALEVATGFLPLAEGDVLAPIERGQIVRVELPRAAMRVVGLPVREERLEERVRADILLSEEGVAQAIRFVQYTQ